MLEGLLMFFIQDALFLLGYLARGNAFPKPLNREEEAEKLFHSSFTAEFNIAKPAE